MVVKNRSILHVRNSLASIRQQDFPQELVSVLIVDYGSTRDCASALACAADEFGAQYLRVNTDGHWHKARGLNIGIKRTFTKYLLSSDSDIVFPSNYLSSAVARLGLAPLSVVYSQCRDLPADLTETLTPSSISDLVNVGTASRPGTPRSCGDCNAGINMTHTRFYKVLRGYDEFYKGWGSEDNDLQRRFELLGLRTVSLSPAAVYFHQWHPKGLGVPAFETAAERNEAYYHVTRSIVRNTGEWGSWPNPTLA